MIPAATLLTAEDISYRFRQYPPSAILADGASAERIDAAEARIGRRTPVKVIIGGASRDGCIDPERIDGQNDDAEPERTRSDDRLLIFFTSGTTGLPKMVVHTQASYPLGHLTTAEWLGVKPNDVHYNISQPGWAKFRVELLLLALPHGGHRARPSLRGPFCGQGASESDRETPGYDVLPRRRRSGES